MSICWGVADMGKLLSAALLRLRKSWVFWGCLAATVICSNFVTTTVTLSGDEALIPDGGQSVTLTTVPALNVVMDREDPFVPVRSLAGLRLAVDYQTPPETITLTIQ